MVKEQFHGLGFVGFRQTAAENLNLVVEDFIRSNCSVIQLLHSLRVPVMTQQWNDSISQSSDQGAVV